MLPLTLLLIFSDYHWMEILPLTNVVGICQSFIRLRHLSDATYEKLKFVVLCRIPLKSYATEQSKVHQTSLIFEYRRCQAKRVVFQWHPMSANRNY